MNSARWPYVHLEGWYWRTILENYLVNPIVSEGTAFFHQIRFDDLGRVACVADETKPRYSPSANQRPKACSVLPGFSIIGSYCLLHMTVLSCTLIGRVDLVEPWLRCRLRSR